MLNLQMSTFDQRYLIFFTYNTILGLQICIRKGDQDFTQLFNAAAIASSTCAWQGADDTCLSIIICASVFSIFHHSSALNFLVEM